MRESAAADGQSLGLRGDRSAPGRDWPAEPDEIEFDTEQGFDADAHLTYQVTEQINLCLCVAGTLTMRVGIRFEVEHELAMRAERAQACCCTDSSSLS